MIKTDKFIVEYSAYMQQATSTAALAQLGERQTEDLKAPCSIHGGGIHFCIIGLDEDDILNHFHPFRN